MLLAFCGLVVLVSIIAAIRVFSGHDKPSPGYENAPPPALLPPSEEGIVDTDNFDLSTWSDEDYLYLHKLSRKVSPLLAGPNWKQQLAKISDTPGIVNQNQDKVEQLQLLLQPYKFAKVSDILMDAPHQFVDPLSHQNVWQTQTSVSLLFTPATPESLDSGPITVLIHYFWVKRPGKSWKVYSWSPQYSSDANSEAQAPSELPPLPGAKSNKPSGGDATDPSGSSTSDFGG